MGVDSTPAPRPPSEADTIPSPTSVNGFADLAHAAAIARAARPEIPLALATLFQVDGSSYQQPGARLLVDAEGRVLAGAVSGGCLEGDVAARAAQVCASGRAERLTYDLRTDLETIWGFGAACDGIAHLLLEPLPDSSWMDEAEVIRRHRNGGALMTLIDESNGGATVALLDGDAHTGRWRFLHQQAQCVTTAELTAIAVTVERTGQPFLRPLGTTSVSVFVEPLTAPVALHLVGAGRGAEAFAGIAAAMGWEVTIIDHRPALLEALQLPAGVSTLAVRHSDAAHATLASLPHDGRTAVALLSHIFDVDAAWLTAALPLPIGYVGVLGSRARGARLLDAATATLATRGTPLTERMTRKLHAPIGLDLGGGSPASIALSAIAEIEAVLHDRPAGFLRERQTPIHTRTPCPRILQPDRTDTRR